MNQSYKKIKVTCKAADLLPIDSLEDFQGGLKKITKANLEKLKKRIIKDGINVPMFVWRIEKWCRILDGHQRLKALLSLREEGWELPLIPVAYIEADNEKDARQKLLGITSQYGEFEIEELGEWMAELDADVAGTLRLADGEIKIKQEIETENDDEVPENVKPVSKLGDLWELGRHRVLCGDSTKIEDVERLMDGKKADMVFTDPPYGVDYDGGIQIKNGKFTKGQRKKLKSDDNENIYSLAIPIMAYICNGAIYTWFAGTKAKTIYSAIEENGEIHALIIWVKNGGYGALNANYKQKHEPCLYWKNKKGKLNFCGNSNETTIWNIDKDGNNEFHPTQKPVALSQKAILNHDATIISDLFLGSGSTLIACEKTDRICYGMELDEHYCDVIVNRYVQWCKDNSRDYSVKLNGKKYVV